jgi:membrane protein YdbS with pleckstrin-like domain
MPVFEQKKDATSTKIPLNPNKIKKKTIESVIGTVFIILIIGFAVILPLAEAIGGLGLICVPVLLVFLVLYVGIIYWYQGLYFKAYYYDITEDSLVVRKGVWFRNQISFNFSRVQDVYVDQDMLDKLFGLYDVHLATAAMTSAPMAHIDGLDEENASKIRDLLLEKIKKANKGQGL